MIWCVFLLAWAAHATGTFTLDVAELVVDAQPGEKYNHKIEAGGDTLVFGAYNLGGVNGGFLFYEYDGNSFVKHSEVNLTAPYRDLALSPTGFTLGVLQGNPGAETIDVYVNKSKVNTGTITGKSTICINDFYLLTCEEGVQCIFYDNTWGVNPGVTVAPPAGASASWGHGCTFDGDSSTVWILDKGHTNNAGAGFVYEYGSPSSPLQTIKMVGGAPDDLAFTHARIRGDMAVVSIPGDDTRSPNAGALVFLRRDIGGPGYWGLAEKVPNDRTDSGVLFGNNDVHFLRPDRVAVPVSSYGDGEVWIYGFDLGTWDNLVQVITRPYPNGTGTDFGIESAVSETHMIVGALHPTTSSDTGPIYTFKFPECDPGGDLCPENKVCSLNRTCEGPIACTQNYDCFGEQQFPVCVDGICRELYDDTCDGPLDCDIKAHRNYASANGVGLISVTYEDSNSDSVVDSWNLTQMLIDYGNPWVTVDYDDSVVLLVDPDVTDEQYKEAVEAKVCGPVPCVITVTRTVAEVTIRMQADLHPESLELLTVNGTFSADLVDRLGDYLNRTVEFAGVNTTGYTVVNAWHTVEGDGITPVPADETNNLITLGINVNQAVNAQGFNYLPTVGQIDRCGNRNCNYHGTCNSDTGVCECTNVNYWGLNCETLVTCENDGWKKADDQYCVCPYPWGGLRCEKQYCSSCPIGDCCTRIPRPSGCFCPPGPDQTPSPTPCTGNYCGGCSGNSCF